MNTVFKALSDSTRREVLALLRDGPLSAGEIADRFNVTRATMSAHFAVLREAGLVTSEKQGKSVIYQVQMSVLEDALFGFTNLLGISAPPETRAPSSRPAGDTPHD